MAKSLHVMLRRVVKRGENVLYRMAGLPITIAVLFTASHGTAAIIRRAYAEHYWSPDDWADALEIGVAIGIWPIALVCGAMFFTWRNGSIIARRSGPASWRQFLQQLQLAATQGILPPWYYIFAMHEPGRRALAGSFLNRCETKRGVYPALERRRVGRSPLDDKQRFAEHCSSHQLATVPVLGIARDGRLDLVEAEVPRHDLFVKPISACGGSGAERWDYIGDGHYRRPDGVAFSTEQLIEHLSRRGAIRPLLVQPRTCNHPQLGDLSNGALITIRVLTCLDELERPEVVGAVLRMAVGDNRTVDNLHAGGIASQVNLKDGVLSSATDLGMNAKLGWLTHHPDTGGQIKGRVLPRWAAVVELAERAHGAFRDHTLIGWDIALLADGPCLVEGNGAPDVDIMQRHGGEGLCSQRFGALLAWHLTHPARGQATPRIA